MHRALRMASSRRGCLCRVLVMAGLAVHAVGFTPSAPSVRAVLGAPALPSPHGCRGRGVAAGGISSRGPSNRDGVAQCFCCSRDRSQSVDVTHNSMPWLKRKMAVAAALVSLSVCSPPPSRGGDGASFSSVALSGAVGPQMEPAFIKFEVVSDDSPKIFRVEKREAARQRDGKAQLVQSGMLATAAASTVAVAGAVTLLPANPTLLRGDALRSKAARLCGQGEGGDTPNSNSTAPAGVQEEFEESVRELREQLEEKDVTILKLRSELTALHERLGNESKSFSPHLPAGRALNRRRVLRHAPTHSAHPVSARAPPALTDIQRRALEASLDVKETEEMEAQLLSRTMREMGLSDRDIAHVMRERDRIKPPKAGEVPWSSRGISKGVAKWLGLHAIE